MQFQFTIPGQPRPKERPRIVRNHGHTPPKTKKYEEEVWWMAYSAGMRQDAFKGQIVAIDIAAYMGETPKDLFHSDLDNIAKAIMDGLKPAFNDAYVVELYAGKYMGPPHCDVLVTGSPPKEGDALKIGLARMLDQIRAQMVRYNFDCEIEYQQFALALSREVELFVRKGARDASPQDAG